MLAGLQDVFDKAMPIVQTLRGDPDWDESDVYGNYSEGDKRARLTSGPLRGSRGLGLQVCLFSFFFLSGLGVYPDGAGGEGSVLKGRRGTG